LELWRTSWGRMQESPPSQPPVFNMMLWRAVCVCTQ
jgi:hypothetical protein